MTLFPGLSLEDTTFAVSLAREMTDRAMQKSWIDLIRYHQQQIAVVRKRPVPLSTPPSDEQWAKDLLARIETHVLLGTHWPHPWQRVGSFPAFCGVCGVYESDTAAAVMSCCPPMRTESPIEREA